MTSMSKDNLLRHGCRLFAFGGAKEKAWCQMLADILDSEITVLEHAELLPAVALAGVTEREPEVTPTKLPDA